MQRMQQRRLTSPEQLEKMRESLADGQTVTYKRKSRIGSGAKLIGNVLFAALIILLIILLVQIIVTKRSGASPSVFGVHIYNIETSSMYPTYPAGCVIISREPDDPAALKEGDVVTFYSTEGNRITHRIVEVTTDDSGGVAYKTKGDNPANSVDAELLTTDRVEAVLLFKVPFI